MMHTQRLQHWLGALLLLVGFSLTPLVSSTALAQTATLRGFVTAASDGQPLPGVNVVLRDDAGGLFGSSADNDGFFAISQVPSGTYTLTASFIGFTDYTEQITLPADEIVTRNIALEDAQTELGEVVVETERETAGGAAVTAGLQTVRPSDIDLIPAPDISGDLVNYLTALPGIISQGDRGGQLFIRGGEPTQNLILLDGMLVYQPFHIVGFFSAFPSEIINAADVYAGGYGGRYGGRLSSVLDVSMRNGNKQRYEGAVSAAPFVSTARLEGPIVPGRLSLVASVRESVIEQGASQLVDQDLPFTFGDAFGKLHAKLSESAQLSVSAISTHDTGRLGTDPLSDDPDAIRGDEVSWQNLAVGTRFIFLPARLPIFAEILMSTSRLDNDFGPPGEAVRSTSAERTSVGVNVTHYLRAMDFNWGLFLNSSTLESDLGGQFQNVETDQEFITEAGLFVEPEIRVGESLRLQPGLRLQTFPSKGETFLEPRFRAIYEKGIHRLSAAGGLYHQEILGLNDRRDAGDVFTAWTSSPVGKVPEAWHGILGWRLSPFNWMDFSVEGFYKKMSNLFIPEWTAFPKFTTSIQQADGVASGFDLRLEVRRSPIYALVSYGNSTVKYDAPIRALELLFGETSVEYSPPHDRRHQLSALINYTNFGFDFSIRWQLGTGLPYNQSLGFDRFILLDSLVNVVETPGDERVLYQRPYEGRLPAYHRLDISLERKFVFNRNTTLSVLGGLINAYDRRNLFYLDLFTLRRVDQLPLIPTFGLKLEFQ